MVDFLTAIAVFFAGFLAGLAFFGGLLLTVDKGLSSRHPALWFFGSWMLRVVFTVGVFYLVSGGQWQRLLICMAGFLVARVALTRWFTAHGKPDASGMGGSDAT